MRRAKLRRMLGGTGTSAVKARAGSLWRRCKWWLPLLAAASGCGSNDSQRIAARIEALEAQSQALAHQLSAEAVEITRSFELLL